MATGSWEVEETQAFLDCLQGSLVCIDIGANVGFYSCLAATRGKRVLAIEPLPRNLQFLYKNLVYNDLCDVEVFPLALSDTPGVKRLYGWADTASFICGWAGANDTQYAIVPATTLDMVAAERFQGVQLTIKLDVEGFEFEVLNGATRTMRLDPMPVWLVEIFLRNSAIPEGVNERFYETFEIFWRCGYRAHRLGSGRPLVQPRDVSRWAAAGAVDGNESNFLFTTA